MRIERCERSLLSTRPMASLEANELRYKYSLSGFTLVELLIATFIASILGVLLFSALYQINRFVPVVDNTTAIYEKAALINAQLEKDISGTTFPNEFYYRQPESEKKAKQQQASADAKAKVDIEKKKGEEEKKEKEESQRPKRPLEKVFYSANKEGNLNQLSFITTNPLQVYWTAKTGSAKPRVTRVLYELKEEKGTPRSFSLIRREFPNLEFDQIAKISKEMPQEFVLADGIRNLAIEYTYQVPEKTQPAGQPEPKQPPQESKKKEIKKATEWNTPQKKEEAEREQLPLAPQMVEFKINLWDSQKRRSTPFVFKIPIRSDIPDKQEAEDLTQKILGTLREFFTQSFSPKQSNTRIAQPKSPNVSRGVIRR